MRSPFALATAAIVLVLAFSAPAPAADNGPALRDTLDLGTQPPPPSPVRARPDSAVLFFDDFSSGDLKGWEPDRKSVWRIENGMLKATLPDRKQVHSLIYAGSHDWRDYAVELDVCMMRGVDKGVVVRTGENRGVGVDLRGPRYHDVIIQQGFRFIGRERVKNPNGVWHRLRVEVRDHRYTVWVNGQEIVSRPDNRRTTSAGRIALPAYTGGVAMCTVYYDNVIVTSLD